MNLVQVNQFLLKGHNPEWLIDVTFLLPVTDGRDVEWRIEEYSVRLSFILPRHMWEVHNEINIQEVEWNGALRRLICLRVRTGWGLLQTR
jgi:hypothetical protein